jgi:glycosyltransferase involved in cell wall biosynthesis
VRTLFVTWDGPGLAYLESLFLPIFAGLQAAGYQFDVLQFRWGDAGEREKIARACRELGIGYKAVGVWRGLGPVGPLLSAMAGGLHVRRAVRHFRSDAIMPRSVLPSLAVLAGRASRLRPIILDADGLELDERVEFAGLSGRGLAYRLLRDVEAQMVRVASSVLVRTPSAREVLLARAGPGVAAEDIHVVTNGRDERLFHPFDPRGRAETRAGLGIGDDAPLIVYAGSVGYRYNTPRIGDLALAALKLRPDTRLLVLSGSPEAASAELLQGRTELAQITTIMRAAPSEVARYLAAADVGTAFVRPSFSTRGVAPVKIGEYLLCGLPVIGAAAVGNNAPLVERGVFFDDGAGQSDLQAAAQWFVAEVLPRREAFRAKARGAGVEHLSLERSVADYACVLAACSGASS